MIPVVLLWFAVTEPEPVDVENIPLPPSLELLEFLGRYEDADGEWLDPMALERDLAPERSDDLEETDADVADTADSPGPAARR